MSRAARRSDAQVIPLRGRDDAHGGTGQADQQTNEQTDEQTNEHGAAPFPSSQHSAQATVVSLPSNASGDQAHAEVSVSQEPDAALPAALIRALSFLRHRLTGEYTVDEFGFDPALTDTLLLPPFRVLYDRWFRVSTHGAHNLPDQGGALLVANHSGTVPLDALMTTIAVHDEHPAHRHLRILGADLVFRTPVVGALARKSGQTLACHPDAERLLRGGDGDGGALVAVWPEGFKGIGKPFGSRYKLQRFGRGGFVSAALRTGVPIIPCSIVGAEEIYPKVGDIKPLARLLGVPYFPVTPLFPLLGGLGAVPLPTKWHIDFGEPIRTDGYHPGAEDDPMLVFGLTDQVREAIQHSLYQRLSERRGVFRG